MILTINDLGAVKHLDVDLSKELTLLCGPNSTGKTYASYVLYAFLENSSLVSIPDYYAIVRSLQDTGEFEFDRILLERWLDLACKDIEGQLGSIFGIAEDTCSKLFSKFKLTCKYGDDDYRRTLDNPINITYNDSAGMLKVTKLAGKANVKFEGKIDDGNVTSPSGIRMVSILNMLFKHLVFLGIGSARMLTVERNSIYTFKTELSLSRNELIDRIQQKNINSELDLLGMVNSFSRRYPLAVRNSLRIANDLEFVQKQASKYAEIALEIEQNLLRGEVSMTKNGDVEFHAATMAKSRRLPFHLSSSIVKTMASLVVYLRHIAQQGDTLIVDEPEMNFHPDVQVVLARIFAKLANSGLHIIISTHSDYIIREINNMIMAGALLDRGKADDVYKAGYHEGGVLKKDKVNVLFFNHKSKAKLVTVKPLAIGDDGFEISTIDDTIMQQNQNAEWLYDCLHN